LPPFRAWEGRYSFSSLIRQSGAFEDSAASDEDVEDPAIFGADADEPIHVDLAALNAYKGENFGIALHAIFEQRVPGRPMRDQIELVRRCLAEAGERLDGIHADALVVRVAARVQMTLDTALLPTRTPALRLSALAAKATRREMGFSYVLDGVSMQRLRAACVQHGEPDMVPAHTPHTLRGLMSGAIDLVFEYGGRFHVLDYKGNYLGDRLGDYAPAALDAEMDRHHYRFQALLYTVALDRYLRQRLPGYRRSEHLGETIYLFVRAAGLGVGTGVWSRRFDEGLIAAVDGVLANAAAGAIA